MAEFIFEINEALYNEDTGELCMKPEVKGRMVRCKDCSLCISDDPYELWCSGWGHPMRMVPPAGYCYKGKE